VVGPLSYLVKAGPIHILCQDVMRVESQPVGVGLYSESAADSSAKVRIVVEHTTNGTHVASIPRDSEFAVPYPDVVLYGHNHVDRYAVSRGYPQIQTKTSQNLYARLVRFDRDGAGNWSLGSVGYEGSNLDSIRIAGSIYSPYLTKTYQNTNDGTAADNTATIQNDLNETFEHGRIKFVMRRGTFEVAGGTVIDTYDSDDLTKTIVNVGVNIQPNTSHDIQVTATYVYPLPDDDDDGGGPVNNPLQDVKVWPNTLNSGEPGAVLFSELAPASAVKVYTMSGELVKEMQEGGSGQVLWDGMNNYNKGLTPGLYFYVATDSQGNRKSGKIVVQ